MARRARRYFSLEFKREAVRRFVTSGKGLTAIAREVDVHPNVLDRWISELGPRPAAPDNSSSTEGELTTAEMEAELKQLRKDKARLEMEVEILGKATAFFANRNR